MGAGRGRHDGAADASAVVVIQVGRGLEFGERFGAVGSGRVGGVAGEVSEKSEADGSVELASHGDVGPDFVRDGAGDFGGAAGGEIDGDVGTGAVNGVADGSEVCKGDAGVKFGRVCRRWRGR